MEATTIKIYGERNSGTNYLEKLIERNIDARLLRGTVPQRIVRLRDQKPGDELVRDLYFRLTYPHNLGWKHALVEPPERLARRAAFRRPVAIVTMTKNPYAWALSMYRRPYHGTSQGRTLEDFLRSAWPTVGRENGPPAFKSPIDMWNQKNASYLIPSSRLPVLNLCYNDLLSDPQRVIDRIRETFSLRTRGGFVNIDESTKGESKRYADYRAYYLGEHWRDGLGREAIRIINERLDARVAGRFGFSTLK
jgi:hypothetical protein